jgi:hypothetical protein
MQLTLERTPFSKYPPVFNKKRAGYRFDTLLSFFAFAQYVIILMTLLGGWEFFSGIQGLHCQPAKGGVASALVGRANIVANGERRRVVGFAAICTGFKEKARIVRC